MVLIDWEEDKAFLKEACFRPLAGIMVLITLQELLEEKGVTQSFRPLAGIMVLILKTFNSFMVLSFRFRPLAGIMVLICTVIFSVLVSLCMFPSPCGDYGSYHPERKN